MVSSACFSQCEYLIKYEKDNQSSDLLIAAAAVAVALRSLTAEGVWEQQQLSAGLRQLGPRRPVRAKVESLIFAPILFVRRPPGLLLQTKHQSFRYRICQIQNNLFKVSFFV